MLVWKLETAPNNSLILIDEPEIALHPGSQKRLLQWIIKMILKKRLQVILTTHFSFIIEDLSNKSIKCISKNHTSHGRSMIQENVILSEDFHNS